MGKNHHIFLSGIFLGLAANFNFIVSYVGAVNPALSVSFVFAAIFFSFFVCIKKFVGIAFSGLKPERLIFLVILLFLFINLLFCFLPPVEKDELNHHLAFPKLYLLSQDIFTINEAPYSFYPVLMQMLYMPWLSLGWDYGAKLTHFLFALMTGLLIYNYLAEKINKNIASFALLTFISTPIIQKLSHTAYADLALIFYGFAGLLALLYWKESPGERKLLCYSAMCCGFALCSKPNGMLLVFIIGIFLLSILLSLKRESLSAKVRHLFVFLLLTCLCTAPWYYRNIAEKNNPFYPQFKSIFNPEEKPDTIHETDITTKLFVYRMNVYGESLLEVLLVPLRVFIDGEDGNARKFDGVFSPLLLVFLFWAFKGEGRKNRIYISLFTIGYFCAALYLAGVRARYLSPAVPGFVMLSALGLHNLYNLSKHQIIINTAISLLVAWNFYYTLQNFNKYRFVDYFFADQTREEYLSSRMSSFDALEFSNQNLPEDAKVYLVFTGRQIYYLDRDFYFDETEFPLLLVNAIKELKADDLILEALHEKGITHLLLRDGLFARYFSNNLKPEELAVWQQFYEKHLRLLYRERGYSVLEIRQETFPLKSRFID